jgi:hypothetical protein
MRQSATYLTWNISQNSIRNTPPKPWKQFARTPDPTKELAKKHHDKTMPTDNANSTTLCIYTDGSGINNHIGAAAHCPTTATNEASIPRQRIYTQCLCGGTQRHISSHQHRQGKPPPLHQMCDLLRQSSRYHRHHQTRSTIWAIYHLQHTRQRRIPSTAKTQAHFLNRVDTRTGRYTGK